MVTPHPGQIPRLAVFDVHEFVSFAGADNFFRNIVSGNFMARATGDEAGADFVVRERLTDAGGAVERWSERSRRLADELSATEFWHTKIPAQV